MNIGFYLPYLETNMVDAVTKELKSGFDNGELLDASIFFDTVGPTNRQTVCGMFDATNLWYFTGTLIVLTPDSLAKAKHISNKFKLVYYAGAVAEQPVLHLLPNLTNNVRCIASNPETGGEFTRLTGRQVEGYFPGFRGVCEWLKTGELK